MVADHLLIHLKGQQRSPQFHFKFYAYESEPYVSYKRLFVPLKEKHQLQLSRRSNVNFFVILYAQFFT